MKLFLVVSLCAIVAIATDRAVASSADDSGLGEAMPGYPGEQVPGARRFDAAIGGVQNDGDSGVVVPGSYEAAADDLEEDYAEVDNNLEDESSRRSKRSPGCSGGAQLGDDCGEGCGRADCTSNAEKIQQHMSRLEGIRDLLAYKKAMLREKIASHLGRTEASLGASIAAGHGLDLSHGGSCCPDLPCCPSYRK